MEAQVTIKCTAAELDILRRALKTHITIQNGIMNSTEADPKVRREARTELVLTQELLTKL